MMTTASTGATTKIATSARIELERAAMPPLPERQSHEMNCKKDEQHGDDDDDLGLQHEVRAAVRRGQKLLHALLQDLVARYRCRFRERGDFSARAGDRHGVF